MRVINLSLVACDWALAALLSLYLAFAYLVVEYRLPYIPVCPFLLITGHRCPLCGSTRLIGAFLHGEVALEWAVLPSVMWFVFVLSALFVSVVRVAAHFAEPSHPRVAMSN